MGFFFLVCKVSSSSVLIFIGDNGGVVLVGGGGCVIFLLSSSTRNLANSFSAVTTNDDGGKDGTGGGDSIVVYVFKVVSKRAFARRFFPYFCRKCTERWQYIYLGFHINPKLLKLRLVSPLRRRIQLSGEPFEVLGRDDAVIGHERQIDFFEKVDKLSRWMCDGVDVSTRLCASRAEVF